MGTIALLVGVVALIWVWVRGTRHDYDEMVERQQQRATHERETPTDRNNPDFIPGHTGRSDGLWFWRCGRPRRRGRPLSGRSHSRRARLRT